MIEERRMLRPWQMQAMSPRSTGLESAPRQTDMVCRGCPQPGIAAMQDHWPRAEG